MSARGRKGSTEKPKPIEMDDDEYWEQHAKLLDQNDLSLCEIPHAQRHKDSHSYAYLVTTRQGSSGPCLVFCNSIAAVQGWVF